MMSNINNKRKFDFCISKIALFILSITHSIGFLKTPPPTDVK